jgi:hypothetical protein
MSLRKRPAGDKDCLSAQPRIEFDLVGAGAIFGLLYCISQRAGPAVARVGDREDCRVGLLRDFISIFSKYI